MQPLAELAWVFLRLGLVSFGGPAAHIALMEDELVVKRRWLTRADFLDLVGASNLLPGPSSTELALHLGQRRGGAAGLLVAGVCFILPSALIVAALAAIYARTRAVPRVDALLAGMKPVVFAIVAHALVRLARTALKDAFLVLYFVVSLVGAIAGTHELVLLAIAGTMGALSRRAPSSHVQSLAPWPLFLVFAKIGATLFGSGYVLLAYLRRDLVERAGWLSERELIDAITVGQVTPGPVFTTATFIGWLLGGPTGASLATVAIFLPAFLFVACSGWLVPRIRQSPLAGGFLDGVNAASLALMVGVALLLGRSALVSAPTIALSVLSLLILVRRTRSSVLLLGVGAVAGLSGLVR